MKKLVLAMAAGAALAWLFDPDNGSHRRESVKRTLQEKGLMTPPPSSTEPTTCDPHTMPSDVSAIR